MTTFTSIISILTHSLAAADATHCYIPTAPTGHQFIKLMNNPWAANPPEGTYVNTAEGRWTCGGNLRDTNNLCYLNGSAEKAQTCPVPERLASTATVVCVAGRGQCLG